MSERYIVSPSASHACCNAASVRDAQTLDTFYQKPVEICECLEVTHAELIAKALNEMEDRKNVQTIPKLPF